MKRIDIPEYGILPGDIVYVTAGKGQGGLCVAMRVDNGYADLCDGKARTIEKPKRKKFRHMRLMWRDGIVPRTNAEVRRVLAQYAERYAASQQHDNHTTASEKFHVKEG